MIYSFGECSLDTKRHELRRGGEPQHVDPQVYAVAVLPAGASRPTRHIIQELIERAWVPGSLRQGC